VYFADIAYAKPEPNLTLPPKFERLLSQLDLPAKVKGKAVGIKMHFGGGTGYTTIHPVFLRILIKALKDAGAKTVKCMDGTSPESGIARGYTREVLGCEVVSCFGATGKYVCREKIGFKSLDVALLGGEACDCDFFIDLAHIKGHGCCGFGGCLKNIAMGVTPGETRGKIHRLEGGISYDRKKCIFCKKCIAECKNEAISGDEKEKCIEFFFHNCTYCQHCIMVCPVHALTMQKRTFEDFSQGMAKVTAAFLKKFAPENLLFLNFLLDITIYCDCWGMSTPSLVPDIGILCSTDIVAIETAALDMIKTDQLLPNGLPKGKKLHKGRHLFERIHGKDPYLMLRYLEHYYGGSSTYSLKDVD